MGCVRDRLDWPARRGNEIEEPTTRVFGKDTRRTILHAATALFVVVMEVVD